MQSQYNIEDIKVGLKECLALANAPSMTDLANAIRLSISKLDEPMQLAIIGKISSSKSTLVNAILGKDELMSTGQKEITYNVGWLKYGNPDSDIVINYKDGRPPQKRSREEFQRLSVDVNHSDIDNISYIETFDDSEILRDINIIDTPGLNAKREKDSQNTLDFISKVRPDAVVMLFTHSVEENVLDVVSHFNAGSSFNPLNAIGILSKIDVLWQETIPRSKTALEIGRRMVTNRKRKDAMISKTLFDLYPVSALLYLASSTVTSEDVCMIEQAYRTDSAAMKRALNSMKTYCDMSTTLLSEQARDMLVQKMGLYGIWLIVQRIEKGQSLGLDEVRKMFIIESGARDFQKSLYNHFGSRAKLIKIESVYQHINQNISRIRAAASNAAERSLLSTIEQKISDVFSSLVHEHREYHLLNQLYEGTLVLDDEVEKEFKALCGENGNSAPEKLGLPAGTLPTDMLNHAISKERYWRGEIALEPDPVERQWMSVILKSYTNLRNKISQSIYQYQQAKNFLFN
ncbi:MAG: dynamin family protein [Muribaculaceae bacterium]|nr:dynamin family protein [Muribaculaceae bacterium]